MFAGPLPERIKAKNLFSGITEVNGLIPLGKLKRLSDYLVDDKGAAEVSLEFSRDELGLRQITGKVSASVSMICQRCLTSTTLVLQSEFCLYVVDSEQQAKKLDVEAECVVIMDDNLALWELVEDELILSLPIVAYHDNSGCNEQLNSLGSKTEPGQPERQPAIKDESVFAELAALKSRLQKDSES